MRHPMWSGIGFETLLVGLFMCFPVGPCNQPAVGVAIVFLHYPAGIFVERVLGIEYSITQLQLIAALMVPVWILLIFLLGRFVGLISRVNLKKHDVN